MTRTSLDDARWASLMLAIQQVPRAWKRDEAALRRFVEAVLWVNGGGRVARPFGFALTDPGMRLSRTRLFPRVTRVMPRSSSRGG